MLNDIEGLRGLTPWILNDFRSPKRNHPKYQNFWNRKGLIAPNGEKKKAWYILNSFYKDKEKNFNK